METKSLSVEIKDAEAGIVRAVFARTEQLDRHKDWTLPGAFGEQKVRISAYGHKTTTSGVLPVGKGVIKEVGNLAVADLQFFMGIAAGREHFEVIKAMGDMQEWSYGFAVKEVGTLTDALRQKGVSRVLAKLEVHEVSPVLVGAGFNTQTLMVKADEPLTDRVDLVRSAIYARGDVAAEPWYAIEVFEESVIVEAGGGRKLRVAYSLNDEGAVVLGDAEEVEVVYQPVQKSGEEPEATEPDERELIAREVARFEANKITAGR